MQHKRRVGGQFKEGKMSCKAFWEVVTTLLLGLSLSAALQASIDRGVIQGTVTDPAGALVPGAKVVVKNVDTNVEVTLVTNAAGFYLAPELVPGRYTVRAESPGFVRLDVTNIVVTAGVTSQQDLTLRVGALTQSIEVTAAAPLVDSTPSNYTTSLKRVISGTFRCEVATSKRWSSSFQGSRNRPGP